MFSTGLLITCLLVSAPEEPSAINPSERVLLREVVAEWEFEKDTDGWKAEQQCRLSAESGVLIVQATDKRAHFHQRVDCGGGKMLLEIRTRSRGAGDADLYWMTRQSPRHGDQKKVSIPLVDDNQWHDYVVPFFAPGDLRDLRIQLGNAGWNREIDSIRLIRQRHHPLEVADVEIADERVYFSVVNRSAHTVEFLESGTAHTLAGDASLRIERPTDTRAALNAVGVTLETAGLPNIARTVYLYQPSAEVDWIHRELGRFTLDIASDGSVGRIQRDGNPVAYLAPLVLCEGQVPCFTATESGDAIRLHADAVDVKIVTEGEQLHINIDSEQACEGPVLRVLGEIEQGLMAGLEFLGAGEASSSTVDIETEQHLRYAPDPLKMTMPLMAVVTDRVSAAMIWSDTDLHPVFASPNFFDRTDDHRMALRGNRMDVTIRLSDAPLEDSILWAVNRLGLPPLPEAPRDSPAQAALCLESLLGPLKQESGWGHCAEPGWPRKPFSDMASTVWRLSGQIPALPKLTPGGSLIPNDSIYFVTDRIYDWQTHRVEQVHTLLDKQKEDGSFSYEGKNGDGHHEETASGHCARLAVAILEYAWITGDEKALSSGLLSLESIRRFRTPRGAQTWHLPLHTPDLLASAYLVQAYVRGYELTGEEQYLTEARRWALSGIPFVYLWQCHPIMAYATVPAYGASDRRDPVWIGLPMQSIGLVYAHALAQLAPHDTSVDWKHLAWGILIAAEQMQYPDGADLGLLPEAFDLQRQRRLPLRLNSCAVASLRMTLEGKVDSLTVVANERHRVASPFPVTLLEDEVRVEAIPRIKYQLLINGRTVDITSDGTDVIHLK